MMAATGYELLDELEEKLEEDEIEEEVAELEPIFSRGKPIPVSRSMPRAAHWDDLEDEFENEAAELELLFPRRNSLEFVTPMFVRRPAPNAVDPDAAEPIFTGRVRTPQAALLDVATLKSSSQWNQATHPKVSGITLADLRARLERYIDRATLDNLVRRANTAGKSGPYGSDEATLVTLLAHQFQRKTCRTPTVGEITKRCATNGRVGEDTLDALGFVYHTGETLNTADKVNQVAAATLRRVPASAFAGIEPGLTAKTWWSYMVSPPWLGMPIKHGIHLILLKRLRRAQHALMNLQAYANLSPAELGKALGLEEEHKGARPSNADWSMHLFGLAIDIGYTRNPWLSNPKRDTAKIAAITLRAARLVGPSGSGARGITARYLHDLAIAYRDTDKVYKTLADRSMWLGEYFALAGDTIRLQSLLRVVNMIYPGAGWFEPGESPAAAATRWTRVVQTDFNDFAKAVSRGDKKDEVRHGFMDLARDLVTALRDEGCLGWGAVDFGPVASGDVMHFDCRIDGVGRTIAKTSGKPYVPKAGHPCIPAGGFPATQREYVRPWKLPDTPVGRRLKSWGVTATIERPPPGKWLPFTSNAIQEYCGIVEWAYKNKPSDGGPKYGPKEGRKTAYWVYLSTSALKANAVEVLVFFHGDLGSACTLSFDPNKDWKTTYDKNFQLDWQVEQTRRPVVVIVPSIYWKGYIGEEDFKKKCNSSVDGKWTAATLNKFIDEAINNIAKQWRSTPAVKCLVLAGHSGAHRIFNPLANEFKSSPKTASSGKLAMLKEVWALDETYGTDSVEALQDWAKVLAKTCRFTAVLNDDVSEGWDCTQKNKIKPFDCWKSFYPDPKRRQQPLKNLKMIPVGDSHCRIPQKWIETLLSAMPPC